MESVLPPLPIESLLSLPVFFISRVPASMLRPRLRWFGVGGRRINKSREFCTPPLHFIRCRQLLTAPLPLEPFELQITVPRHRTTTVDAQRCVAAVEFAAAGQISCPA